MASQSKNVIYIPPIDCGKFRSFVHAGAKKHSVGRYEASEAIGSFPTAMMRELSPLSFPP